MIMQRGGRRYSVGLLKRSQSNQSEKEATQQKTHYKQALQTNQKSDKSKSFSVPHKTSVWKSPA